MTRRSTLSRWGWVRTDPPSEAGKLTARYTHHTGYTIMHCGHPTALWPYGLYRPDGDCIGTHRTLELAAGAHVADLIARLREAS